MFEIINETEEKIEELDYLNNYISYVVKKEKLENCYFVKVGTTTLIKNVMSIFTQIRRNEIENK